MKEWWLKLNYSRLGFIIGVLFGVWIGNLVGLWGFLLVLLPIILAFIVDNWKSL